MPQIHQHMRSCMAFWVLLVLALPLLWGCPASTGPDGAGGVPDIGSSDAAYVGYNSTFGGYNMYLVDTRTRKVISVGSHKGVSYQYSWAPDGNALYLSGTERDGEKRRGIFVLNFTERTSTLLYGGATCESPFVSPDGATIAFVDRDGAGFTLNLMNRDGSNIRTVAAMQQPPLKLVWAADSKVIFYAAWVDGTKPVIVQLDVTTGQTKELVGHTSSFAVNPAHNLMAYGSNNRLLVYYLTTDSIANIINCVCSVSVQDWSPTGNQYVSAFYQDFASSLGVYTATGELVSVAEAESPTDIRWSPDGERFLYRSTWSRSGQNSRLYVMATGVNDAGATQIDERPELLNPQWRPGY